MAKSYVAEVWASDSEWRAARLSGIGASEASAVVDLSRFCGPYGLWVRKTERRVEDDDPNLGKMLEAAKLHEPTIARWFASQATHHGRSRIVDPGDFTIFRSVERPHVFATCDRLTVDAEARIEPVELKCAWYDAAKEWNERIPVGYQIQLQHQMYALGAQRGYFCVLLNGYDFRWYGMERNQIFIDRLMARIDAFWEHVRNGDPPAASGHPTETKALAGSFPNDNGNVVELSGEEWVKLAAEWDAAKEAEKQAVKRAAAIANQIKQELGAARAARLPDGSGWKWTTGKSARTFKRARQVNDEQQSSQISG